MPENKIGADNPIADLMARIHTPSQEGKHECPDPITIDREEVARFAAIAPQWWDEAGAFRPLHRLNDARLGFVRDRLAAHFDRDVKARRTFAGLRLLDIGCGGGLMCEPMARLGCTVTGIDADEAALAVARRHAKQQDLAIDYRADAVESLARAIGCSTRCWRSKWSSTWSTPRNFSRRRPVS